MWCAGPAVVGDLRDEANVRAACQGCDIVFHVASYGMSGQLKAHVLVASLYEVKL